MTQEEVKRRLAIDERKKEIIAELLGIQIDEWIDLLRQIVCSTLITLGLVGGEISADREGANRCVSLEKTGF